MEKEISLSNISDYVAEEDEIWILSLELDSLIEYNYKKCELKKIIELPEKEKKYQRPLFGTLYKFEKKYGCFRYMPTIFMYMI